MALLGFLRKGHVGDYERQGAGGQPIHVHAYEKADNWSPIGHATASQNVPGGMAAPGHFEASEGGWHMDGKGDTWWVKRDKYVEDRMRGEYVANRLYHHAGVKVPEGKLVTIKGKLHYASKAVPGAQQPTIDELSKHPDMHAGFAADAWLNNRDIFGNEGAIAKTGKAANVLKDKDGHIVRIDHGGTLHFSGMNPAPKPFTDKVGETDSLKNPQYQPTGAKVFGKMDPAHLGNGVSKIAAIHPDKIREVVGSAGFDPRQASKVYKTLIARQQDMAQRFGPGDAKKSMTEYEDNSLKNLLSAFGVCRKCGAPMRSRYPSSLECPDCGDIVRKSHVKGYWRKGDDGKMEFVHDHDDSRLAGGGKPFQGKPAFTASEQTGKVNTAGDDDPAARAKALSETSQAATQSSWKEKTGRIGKLNTLDGVQVWHHGNEAPDEVNGQPLKRWQRPADWSKHTEGQHPHFEEPPLEKTAGYGQSAGVITVEPDGRVWIVEPHNHFAGYEHTFPKGTVEKDRHTIKRGDEYYVGGGHEKKDPHAPGWTKDASHARTFGDPAEAKERLDRLHEKGHVEDGEAEVNTEKGGTLQQTAQREVAEEAGLKTRIIGHLGDFHRPGSNTRYYIGTRTGGHPGNTDRETYATKLVPHEHLDKFLNHPVDKEIAGHLKDLLARAHDRGDGDYIKGLEAEMGEGHWEPKMPDKPRAAWSMPEDWKDKPSLLGASLKGATWAPKPSKKKPKPGTDAPEMGTGETEKTDVPKKGQLEAAKDAAKESLSNKPQPVPEETLKEKLARLFLWKSEREPLEAIAKARRLHFRTEFQGLPVSIENRRGSWRKWHDPHTGRDGATKMLHHYGYIRLTEGADGDHVDCFIGPNPDAEYAYVVRQVSPTTGEYDEDKAMLGFDSQEEARQAYMVHYDDPRFYGHMVTMPMAVFRARVKETKDKPGPVSSEERMRGDAGDVSSARHGGPMREFHDGMDAWPAEPLQDGEQRPS